MSLLLEKRSAVVTGAGQGLGRQIALTLAEAGASVVAADWNPDTAAAVAEEIRTAGGRAVPFKVDVSDTAQMEELCGCALREFGQVDVWVNNAGIARPAMLHKMSRDQWDSVIAVHLTGTFNGLRAVASHMMERRSGAVVNLSSIAGVAGTVGQVNYSAAKAGIIGLTKSAAKEMARYNVRVNAIAPGVAETAMTETLRSDEKLRASYIARIPLQRFAQPSEIAPAVLFLVSDAGAYITGQVLNVDGGMVM